MASKATTLHQLFLNKLMALYDVEIELAKALPKLAKKADIPALKKALTQHAKITVVQAKRLEKAFKLLEAKPKKLKSDAIRGLIADAMWVTKNIKAGSALDAGLIAAVQYIEHYEMAGYGTVIEWAKLMRHSKVEVLLNQTLAEEKAADEALTSIAKISVNPIVDIGHD